MARRVGKSLHSPNIDILEVGQSSLGLSANEMNAFMKLVGNLLQQKEPSLHILIYSQRLSQAREVLSVV